MCERRLKRKTGVLRVGTLCTHTRTCFTRTPPTGPSVHRHTHVIPSHGTHPPSWVPAHPHVHPSTQLSFFRPHRSHQLKILPHTGDQPHLQTHTHARKPTLSLHRLYSKHLHSCTHALPPTPPAPINPSTYSTLPHMGLNCISEFPRMKTHPNRRDKPVLATHRACMHIHTPTHTPFTHTHPRRLCHTH